MTSRHPFPVGEVAALGLSTGECRVGLIEGADQTHVRITLFSWLTGEFSMADLTVHRSLIEEALFAGDGVPDRDGRRVFNMDPLADFQAAWKPTNDTSGD